ncbi:MAG: F0F1 ATP synthase subunit alpha [Defluviitaleaceae bacterium]|nr:F0F1 ATP synthase subunit alpha [Defluviitaleaceae bacterium]
MLINASEINTIFKNEVLSFVNSAKADEVGRVMQVGDGIARAYGITNVMSGELLTFENGVAGIAMNLEEDNVAVVILGSSEGINEGSYITRTGEVARVPVGDGLLGRVVNALGQPIDHTGALNTSSYRPIERIAPGVLVRKKVDVPLMTGIRSIDAMSPIGRGQRQLIIGDRQTGKTSIAVDTILNQKGNDVYCVYVAIGQKNSTVADIVNTLNKFGAMEYTTVVSASASEVPAMQYFAPFSGCAIAEEWMENNKDVLIIYDDLSKHAVAYRSMSLLLRRPPGREAYPGDVFYLHSRLLERAGRLEAKHGGGSITAFPIIETQAGNMSAYIPTNVISITDGQIYLETEMFNAGIRPAMNPGLSVSRVGGAAQYKAMRKIAAPLRTELAQYRELASFAQFSADLDKDTQERLSHGERIIEILKQPINSPTPFEQMIITFYAASNKFFEDIKVEEVAATERRMIEYFKSDHSAVLEDIAAGRELTDDIAARIKSALASFKEKLNAKAE